MSRYEPLSQEKHQKLIELKGQGLSQKQVADALGISKSCAHNYWHKAELVPVRKRGGGRKPRIPQDVREKIALLSKQNLGISRIRRMLGISVETYYKYAVHPRRKSQDITDTIRHRVIALSKEKVRPWSTEAIAVQLGISVTSVRRIRKQAGIPPMVPPKVGNPERDAKIREMYAAGVPTSEIVRQLGLSSRRIVSKKTKGLPRNKCVDASIYARRIVHLIERCGMSRRAVAKELGLSHETVIRQYRLALERRERYQRSPAWVARNDGRGSRRAPKESERLIA